jgi:hypothetical protein
MRQMLLKIYQTHLCFQKIISMRLKPLRLAYQMMMRQKNLRMHY